MKILATLSAGLLFLILGVATVAHSQEPKEEGKPAEAHPGAAAPRPQPSQPRPEARPQAEPAVRPPAAAPRQDRTNEAHPPQPHPTAARPPQEPEARPPAPNAHDEHPPQARPPEERERHEAAQPQHEMRSPEPQNRTVPVQPTTTARPQPQPATRPTPEEPRSGQYNRQAPTAEQQQDWERHRAANWQAEHRDWRERGGYHGYRVPQQHYQAYFGPPHTFRIYQYPVAFYDGYPRFQYGNYWVQVVDPWPNYWSPNWFYTDPVYVTYLNDGYYLINTLYPDVPLAVEIFGE